MTPHERKNFESIRDNVHSEPMTQVEAMKLALETLEEINKLSIGENAIFLPAEIDTAMDALRQAIEQTQKQEPVATNAQEAVQLFPEVAYWYNEFLKHNTTSSQPEQAQKQEPVGRFSKFTDGVWREVTATSAGQPLYATPPQRQPLTLNQLREHWQVAKVLDMTHAEIDFADYVLIARDVEALHGIKETQ